MIRVMNRHEDDGRPSEWHEIYLREIRADGQPGPTWEVDVVSDQHLAHGQWEIDLSPGQIDPDTGQCYGYGRASVGIAAPCLQAYAREAALAALREAGVLGEGGVVEGSWDDFGDHPEATMVRELMGIVREIEADPEGYRARATVIKDPHEWLEQIMREAEQQEAEEARAERVRRGEFN